MWVLGDYLMYFKQLLEMVSPMNDDIVIRYSSKQGFCLHSSNERTNAAV